jgi:hypothetical protein
MHFYFVNGDELCVVVMLKLVAFMFNLVCCVCIKLLVSKWLKYASNS